VRAESAGRGRGTTMVVELPSAGSNEWAAATGPAMKAAAL
jgi:hypothetical protein